MINRTSAERRLYNWLQFVVYSGLLAWELHVDGVQRATSWRVSEAHANRVAALEHGVRQQNRRINYEEICNHTR